MTSVAKIKTKAPEVDLEVGGVRPSRTGAERLEVEAFARRLHELMARKGLSQSDLARAVWGPTKDTRGYDVAKNRDRISNYLRGLAVPDPSNMAAIAEKLGVTVAELAPDQTASAIDRAKPTVSMSAVAGHDKTYLQVNKLVSFTLAAKIITLLSEEEA
jgi:transcriptional regulator with XRE-family HTH domain